VVELKAEKQRADQEAGLKPKPASKTRTTTDEEAKDAATGFQGWLSRNKPIAAFAVVAFVAVCVQGGCNDAALTNTYSNMEGTAVLQKQHCNCVQCTRRL